MRLKLVYGLMLFFATLQFAFAQEKNISGVVKDAEGEPLPGVTVMVKGTTRGVATGFDGEYTIKAKVGETLEFSAVGMKTVERKVGTTSKIDVQLADDVMEVDEVVVTGYGTVKKSEFVGTAAQVNMGSVENKSVSTVAQALAGEVAGVRIINNNGQPGSNPVIRIRGLGSVNGNRNPLFVVDGVPYSGNVASINPDDIESTTVLKDASATAIYGARGANGVIVINTKTGKLNKDYIQIESKVGFNTRLLPLYDVISSQEEYLTTAWRALYNNATLAGNANPGQYASANLFGNNGISPRYNMWNATGADLVDPATGQIVAGVQRTYTPENWEDYSYKTSLRKEYNLGMGGGSGKTTYYVGLGYLNDEGYSINSGYERYTGRLNATYTPKTWLSGSFNLGYTHSKAKQNGQSEDSNNVFDIIQSMPSIYPVFLRDDNGNLVPDPYYGGYQYDYGTGRGFNALTNGVANAVYDSDKDVTNEVNANFFLKADIWKGLSAETRVGVQYYAMNRDLLRNPYYGGSASTNGSIFKRKSDLLNITFLQLLRYRKGFGDHHLEAFAAHETTDYKYNYTTASKTGLANRSIGEFNNAITMTSATSYVEDYKLESFFGQLNYDYLSKYFLSASLRRDGSSRFLNKKWGTFPSVGLGWAISREDFLKDNKNINNLKLKASYGLVGEQAGVGYYPGYNVYDIGNLNGLIAASYRRAGYPDLTWETSKIFQVGVDFAILKNRIEGSVDYYNKRTTDLIFDKRLAPSTGNAIFKDNDGILVNRGIEITLTGHIISNKDFFVDLSINAELLKNELKQMPYDESIQGRKIIDVSEANYGRAEGHSIYDFYMREWAGVNSQTGAAQWTVHYVDKNNNNTFDAGEQITSLHEYQVQNPGATILQGVTETYSQATQKFVGKSIIPDVRGAVNLNVGYKGFTLGAQMLYSIGGYAYDGVYGNLMHVNKVGSRNWHPDILNSWKQPGDITNVPRLTSAYTGETNANARSTRFLTKADYLLLNNVTLGYTVPQEFLKSTGIGSLAFTISGDNLWLNSARRGFNPSTSETGSSGTYRYNPSSSFVLGAKVQF